MTAATVVSLDTHTFIRTLSHNDPNKDRVREVFSRLWEAAEEFSALVVEVNAQREVRREAEHDEAIASGRRQLGVVEGLEDEIRRAESMVFGLDQNEGQARAALLSVKESEPHLNRFPSKEEIAGWKRSVEAAEHAHEEAMKRLTVHNNGIGGMRLRLQRERATLQDLRQREFDLRSAAEKVQPNWDADTGLSMTPAKYPQVSA